MSTAGLTEELRFVEEDLTRLQFQAIRAHRAAGADGDGMRHLVPGLGHVPGHGKRLAPSGWDHECDPVRPPR
jgi:hypothetical protein